MEGKKSLLLRYDTVTKIDLGKKNPVVLPLEGPSIMIQTDCSRLLEQEAMRA